MVAPPRDPEGETEKTFEFIRMIKRRYPDTEVMIYVYTPLRRRMGRQEPAVRAAWRRAARLRRRARGVSQHGRRMGGGRVDALLVSSGCAVAVASVFAGESGFHDSTGMQRSRPSWTCVPLRGESPRCERSRPGAIAMASTIIPGNWISGRRWYG